MKDSNIENTHSFAESIFMIHNEYFYFPRAFSIGKLTSTKGMNEGSAKIFAYAKVVGLTTDQTLRLFGEHYQNVLDTPEGDSHLNIRELIDKGIDAVSFSGGLPLQKRSQTLELIIVKAWKNRANISREQDYVGRSEVFEIFSLIEEGLLAPVAVNPDVLGYAESRAEAEMGVVVFPWVKQALLLGLSKQFQMRWIDKIKGVRDFIPLSSMSWDDFEKLEKCPLDSRHVPSGFRKGTRFEGVQGMANFWQNSGAVVGSGTMIDASATVGSCAYVGKNCHISGKAGVGGVFEPMGAIPTVVGDEVFIGIGSEPTEGAIIGSRAVLATNVIITSGTRIYDMREGSSTFGTYWFDFIPHDTLVITGNYQLSNEVSCGCVVIKKDIDRTNRDKVSINQLLRK